MDDEGFLALSGIQHIAFCPRQWALIHIEKQWLESFHTAEGRLLHERAHDASLIDNRSGVIIAHAVPLRSEKLRLYGEADTVEFRPAMQGVQLAKRTGFYQVAPIEYKKGKSKIEDWDRVQVCAQALCLEEMLEINVPEGAVFYWETRRREQVTLSDALREKTIGLIQTMHSLYKHSLTPKPQKSKLCKACSMQDICLPKLTKPQSVSHYLETALVTLGGEL